MTVDDYTKALLAIVIYREARSDGVDGMSAVGHVLANRVKAGWGNWISVITKPKQFSSMTILGDTQTIVWPTGDAFLLNLAEAIFLDDMEDPTHGALYYANEANVTSGWYKENIMDSADHPVLVKVGRQTFRK